MAGLLTLTLTTLDYTYRQVSGPVIGRQACPLFHNQPSLHVHTTPYALIFFPLHLEYSSSVAMDPDSENSV